MGPWKRLTFRDGLFVQCHPIEDTRLLTNGYLVLIQPLLGIPLGLPKPCVDLEPGTASIQPFYNFINIIRYSFRHPLIVTDRNV